MGFVSRFLNLASLLKLSALFSVLLSSFLFSAQANAATTYSSNVKVCAVPQLYNALNAIAKDPTLNITPFFATSSDLYAQIANSTKDANICDVVLSSDEKLPIRLIRSQKADGSSLKPFIRAPLVMWSADPRLFSGKSGISLMASNKIKSIAIAKPSLSPVGFATKKVLSSNNFKTANLKDHIYRAEQEYQVFSMVISGNVQVGFITKPLVNSLTHEANGSYWAIPRSYYPDIQYYVVVMQNASNNPKVTKFVNDLMNSHKIKDILEANGFSSLNAF